MAERKLKDSLVSVCLPVYQGERYLSASIESVLNQTHENLELIVVDDRSTDSSAELIKKYEKADKRVTYYLNETRKGIFANYNCAMAKSHGEYIKLTAQDDNLEKDCIETLLSGLIPPVVLVTSPRIIVDSEGNEIGIEKFFEGVQVIPGEEFILEYVKDFVNRVGNPCQTLFPRHLMGEGFDAAMALSGDIDFWINILRHGSLLHLEKPLSRFRRHSGSVTVSTLKDMSYLSDSIRLAHKLAPILEAKGLKLSDLLLNAVKGLARKFNYGMREWEIDPSELISEDNDIYKEAACFALLYAAQVKESLDQTQFELRKSKMEFDGQLEGWRKRAEELSSELESIKNSKAWKLTEPMRKVRSTKGKN